jgi:hypothetical protein
MRKRILAFVLLSLFTLPAISAQEQKAANDTSNVDKSGHEMSTTDMSSHDSSHVSTADMRDMGGMASDGSAHAMHSMEGRKMDMGPHMKMTTLRELKPGDQEKAGQVVEAARRASEKYADYKVALSDGYKIFLPNLPQKQYHFTNYRYAFEAAFNFNAEHPTSLLYEKRGDDYKLIGVMYTAPKNANWNELDQRIPLSIAQWHAHVNLCLPPSDKKNETWGPNAKFGLAGSITTKPDCDAAGGKFIPQIFGWMVHVYPMEQGPEDIWSVERQAHNHMD